MFCSHREGPLIPWSDIWLTHLWRAKINLHVLVSLKGNHIILDDVDKIQNWSKDLTIHYGQVKRDKKWALNCTQWAFSFSCIPVIWPGREGEICRICIWFLECVSPYILWTEPQGKNLLCPAYKMKMETTEKLEIFFVSIEENIRDQGNTIFTIDCLGHSEY